MGRRKKKQPVSLDAATPIEYHIPKDKIEAMTKEERTEMLKAISSVDRVYLNIPEGAKNITVRHSNDRGGILVQWTLD